MNIGQKLKSTVEDAARHAELEVKSMDRKVAAEKPAAKEVPAHASFAHVDYSKLALLKPMAPLEVEKRAVKAFEAAKTEVARDMHAAAATLRDPAVKSELASAKAVAVPLAKSAGAAALAVAATAKDAKYTYDGLKMLAASIGSGDAPLGVLAGAMALHSGMNLREDTENVEKAVPVVVRDARVAAPVLREAAHVAAETFKHHRSGR